MLDSNSNSALTPKERIEAFSLAKDEVKGKLEKLSESAVSRFLNRKKLKKQHARLTIIESALNMFKSCESFRQFVRTHHFS